MRAARSLYDVLNVSHEAEPVVIEAAYRALMKKYHPDQGGEPPVDAPSAADINRAFAILRDSERRTEYDHYEWARQQQMTLAQYIPPPAAPRAFGWGGWIVALALAAVIVLMARGKEDGAAAEPAADLATPARAEARPAGPSPKFLQSDAPERDVGRLQRVARLSSRTIADAAVEEPVREAPVKRHKASSRRPPGRQARRDKDFLEREGYIY